MASTPLAKGDTIPKPVTTTRRMPLLLAFLAHLLHGPGNPRNLTPHLGALTKAKTGLCKMRAKDGQPNPMRIVLKSLIFLAASLIQTAPASARCEGAVMVGTLHDAYRAAFFEAGDLRQKGAITILFTAGGRTGTDLATAMARAGVTADADRLQHSVEAGTALATALISGQPLPEGYDHEAHIAYLGTLFARSRCANSAAAATPGGSAHGIAAPEQANAQSGLLGKDTSSAVKAGLFVAMLTVVTGLAYAAHRIWTSLAMRRRRVERLPRTPISLGFDLTYTDADGNMKQSKVEALDLSAGGMKLSWPDPPAPGTTVTLTLPIGSRLGQVMWSNAHFAGAMFDDRLSKAELETIRAGT